MTLLRDLDKGCVNWVEVLTPPQRLKEITLSDLRADPKLDADVARRRQVLERRDKMSASQAMFEVLGREPTPTEVRWAQRVWERSRSGRADVDRRHERVPAAHIMVPLVQALTLKWYHGRRGASYEQITRNVNAELDLLEARARADGIAAPVPRATPAAVFYFVSRLPQSVRTVRDEGFEMWAKQERMVDKRVEARYANHIWEIDHTPLDIAAVLSADEPDKTVPRLWATACVDAYTTLPLAVFVSTMTPDAYTTSLVLAMAIRRGEIDGVRVGGLPTILRPDHGRDFMSAHVGRVAAALPIEVDPAAENDPDGKPHVERFMRTLNQALADLPGHKRAEGRSDGAARKQVSRLLTVRKVIEAVREFEYRYITRRTTKSKPAPLERYASSVEWREPEHANEIDLLLLKESGERVLTREGVRFRNLFYKGVPDTTEGHKYHDLLHEKVVLRYHPDDDESVIVYHADTDMRIGEFIREDLWQERFGARGINQEYIRPLKDRSTEYRKLLMTEDRARAKADREAEIATRIEERRESDARAGITRPPTRAEKRKDRSECRATEEKDDLFEGLFD